MNLRALLCISLLTITSVFTVTAHSQERDNAALNTALKEKRVAYRDELREVVKILRERDERGVEDFDGLLQAQLTLADAELAVVSAPQERIAILDSNLMVLEAAEKDQQEMAGEGVGNVLNGAQSRAATILAKIMLVTEQIKPRTNSTELQEQRKAYRDAMSDVVDALRGRYEARGDSDSFDRLSKSQTALLDAELAVAAGPEARAAVLQSNLDTLSKTVDSLQEKANQGVENIADLARAKAARIHTETLLIQEQPKSSTDSAALKKNYLAYRDALQRVTSALQSRNEIGAENVMETEESKIALTNAELALATGPKERLETLESSLAWLKQVEAYYEVRNKQQTGEKVELAKCKASRILSEVRLLEEQIRQSQ